MNDRAAYTLVALAQAHFAKYGFAYDDLFKLRDQFIDVLDLKQTCDVLADRIAREADRYARNILEA